MFLKVLLGIYMGSMVMAIIMYVLAVAKCAHEFKQKHPDHTFSKKHWSDIAHIVIQCLFVFLCPVMNTLLAAILLFGFDEYCKDVVRRVEDKYGLLDNV